MTFQAIQFGTAEDQFPVGRIPLLFNLSNSRSHFFLREDFRGVHDIPRLAECLRQTWFLTTGTRDNPERDFRYILGQFLICQCFGENVWSSFELKEGVDDSRLRLNFLGTTEAFHGQASGGICIERDQ